MDTISYNFAAVFRRFTTSNHEFSTPDITSPNEFAKRQLGGGPIAGISVGVIVFVLLICLCLYPVVIGSIRRRRRRTQRSEHQPPPYDPEVGEIGDHNLPAALPNDYERRLSSTESVKPNDDSSRGNLAYSESKENGHRNLPLDPGAQHAWGSQMIQGASDSPTVCIPGQELAQHVGDGQMTPFPAYDGGVYYPGADPSEPRGANADYYSPSIPSEAFGMYTMSSPNEQSDGSNRRGRGSSLRNSVRVLLRRASGRERTMDSTTSGDAEPSGLSGPSGTEGPASLQTMLPNQDPTDSPTEMSPVTSSPPTAHLTSSPQALGGSTRGVSEDDFTQLPAPLRRSFKYSPPVNPSPGTVNPMDIMPASSEPERWHRTDHDLYLATHQPPSASVSPTTQSNPQFNSVATSTPSSVASPPALPPHVEELTRHDTDQTIKQEHISEPLPDVEMTNAPCQEYLHPEADPGRHFSYPSDQSTPFPSLASTNPSSHNTPTTSHTDTPSPESSGVTPDFRHSASPAASNPSPRHAPGHYACTLNHHARYHAKQHRCNYPNCGKGFGTKTHLQRHINDRHLHSKKFHCAVPSCEYSRAGGKSFLRKDNWKRHMTRIHHVETKDLPEPVEYEEMTDT
ncbi:hypothetical protein NLU13_4178 [Sarocladium strictum]|uniref:C2H2-type domain-containing protein n=1 Tax=Sarocladium strictum TaxID=5046 RepID=A0AA39L8E4_SARSR|nr:hypothetical protein NLU13_4178 [Sarocladium strictum]